LRITKNRVAVGVSALAVAAAGTLVTMSWADAAVTAGAKCAPRGGVTGTPTLICAPVPSSPTAYRWRQITGARGPAGAVGPKGATGPAGAPGQAGKDGVSGVESDGPYPGVIGDDKGTQVEGGNSAELWAADGKLYRSWVRCPAGKVALGGGFSPADQGDAVSKNLQIVASFPTSLNAKGDWDDSAVIKGDKDQSLRPNAWEVQGFYNDADAKVGARVRPFIVCANG
jgi:hypothetical protein